MSAEPALRALVTCPQMQRTIDEFRPELEAAGIAVDLPPVTQALSEAELLEIIDRYDGMIAGDDEVTAAVLAAGRRLRIVSKWGVGVDGIDREAADRHGIKVTNTPGAFGEEVADVAMGYVALLARQLHVIDASVRGGGWAKPVGISLHGKTLGVIGLGSIGRAVVRRGLGFGMDVLGADPYEESRAAAAAAGVRPVPLKELLAQSRFIVLCCPLTPETRHLIDADALSHVGSDAFVVNVSRGPVVQEEALIQALSEGRIAGAALDVFEHEPLSQDNPLVAMPNVILGSHNGSNTEEATLRVSALAVKNLIGGLA